MPYPALHFQVEQNLDKNSAQYLTRKTLTEFFDQGPHTH